MRKIVSLAAIAALVAPILSGCAAQNGGIREHQGAAIGAGTGAVGGAVVGGLLGRKARRGRRRAAGRARRRTGRQLPRPAGEKPRGYETRPHGVHPGQGYAPQDRAGADDPRLGRPGRHGRDPADLRRPHPAGRRHGSRAGDPRNPLQRHQGGGSLGRHRARGRTPGAPSSPSRSPGTPVRGTTASSPRWRRAEVGRTSRRSRSACTDEDNPQ